MNNNQVGQWGEHVAAAWFIKNGYDVYFPNSISNANIDFIVEKNGEIHRIQVKASSHSTSIDSKHKTPMPKVNVSNRGGFDYLFAVHTCGKARLYPADACPKQTVIFSLGIRKTEKNIYDIDLF